MQNNTKFLLGVALLGVGGYMYWKSTQKVEPKSFVSENYCIKGCEFEYRRCIENYSESYCNFRLKYCKDNCDRMA